MRRIVFILAATTAISGLVLACGDDDSSTGPTGSDGGGTDSSTDAGADTHQVHDAAQEAAADSSVAVKCTQTQFDAPCSSAGGDCTGPQNTQIDIAFPTTASPAQYVNNCVKVKVGTDIDFAGDFTFHPLQPAGGDTPTPIPSQTTNPPNGTSGMPELVIKMTTKGTYGFQCAFHSSTMFGAVQVVD